MAFQDAIDKPKKDHKTTSQEIVGLFKKFLKSIEFCKLEISEHVFGPTKVPISIPECQLATTNEIKASDAEINKNNSLSFIKKIEIKQKKIIFT